jgi:hypothetical protein
MPGAMVVEWQPGEPLLATDYNAGRGNARFGKFERRNAGSRHCPHDADRYVYTGMANGASGFGRWRQ